MEQRVRAQRCIEVMHQVDVGGIVEAAPERQHPALREQRLGALVAGLRQQNLMRFLVDAVVAGALFGLLARQPRRDLVHAVVKLGGVFRLA